MTNQTAQTSVHDAELRLLLLSLREVGRPHERGRERARKVSDRLTHALVTVASLVGTYNVWLLVR